MPWLPVIAMLGWLVAVGSASASDDDAVFQGPEEKTRFYYAGFSFVGNHADNLRQYPFSTALAEEVGEDGLPILEQALVRRIRQFQRPDLTLVLGELGDYRADSALSLAFAVDWENVAVEKIGDIYKVVIDLHAQLLLFDYSSMKIVGSYPVAIQIRDAVDKEPEDVRLKSMIRALFLGNEYGANIFDEFIGKLSKIPVAETSDRYIRVTDVVLEDKAVSAMPSQTYEDQEMFRTLTAQSFGKFLSENQGVALLPYTKGEAIGSKMALRFQNGDVFNLEIPSPDYAIHLTVRGFKKVLAGKNHAKASWIYGSFVRIRVEQPDFGNVYLDIPFKHVVIKDVPHSQTQVDDWSAFQESLFSFFDQFTSQISSPSGSWLKKATSEKSAKAQLAAFCQVIERCQD